MKTEKVYGIVYLTSRIFRGEVVRKYVGRHKWKYGKEDTTYLGSGILLTKAIKKYGKECFIRETLQECYSHEDLNKAEAYWVEKLDAVNNPLFYNIAHGGMNPSNVFSKKIYQYDLEGNFIDEYASMAEAESLTNADAGVIGACARGAVKTAGGFQWRFEKLASLPREYQGRLPTAVKCFTLEGRFVNEYDSIPDAVEATPNTNASNIGACCKGRYNTCGGFQWRYSNCDRPVEKIQMRQKAGLCRAIAKVDKITGETIEVYDKMSSAAKPLNVNRNSIRLALQSGGTCAGYFWKYAD